MVAPNNSKPRKSIWQYAFVIGIAALIIAAIVVFGMSTFTTVLTVSGLIIGLFNAFLGSSAPGGEGNWFLGRIKHTLDVSTFLRVATVIVWLATIGIATYGGMQWYREAQKFTLAGRVLTAGGDPVPNLVVVLMTKNRRETTTGADGRFAFAGLELSEEESPQTKLHVEWKNQPVEQDVNLATERQVTIKLPAGEPPFRVSYITLEGAAIDLLLRGQIAKRWDERLSGRYFIIPNSVYSTLKNLTKNFSVPKEAGEGQTFSVENDSGQRENEKLAGRAADESFVGTSADTISRSVSRADLLSISNPEQPWNIEVHDGNPDDVISSVSFWKFASREEISKFRAPDTEVAFNKQVDFYEYVTKSSIPADFFLVTMSFGSCFESGTVNLEPRNLKLRVAVVENVSAAPIRIGQFLVHEFKDQTLRLRTEEEALLKSLPAEQQSWFPQEILSREEKLVIPLDMPMAYPQGGGFPAASSSTLSAVRRNLATKQIVTVPNDESTEGSVDLESARLLSLLNKPPQDKMQDKEYVYGPSLNIESVMVDGVSYPFRQFDISKLVIISSGSDSEGEQVGSCPFVYTYAAESGLWKKEGHILYGRNSAFKESTDEKRLTRFDGRLIIKEEDPEQSFIDFIYIKVTLIDGREKLLYPLNSTLRFQDGNYLTMNQGEQIELQFDGSAGLFVSSYSIVSRGYYIPYARTSNSASTSQKKTSRRFVSKLEPQTSTLETFKGLVLVVRS